MKRLASKAGLIGAAVLVSSAVAGSVALSSASAAAVGSTKGAGKQLVIESWGGAYTSATEKYLTGPFTKATGIKVTFDINGSDVDTPVLLQQQSGNVSVDLLDGGYVGEMEAKNGIQKLPSSLVSYISARSRPGTVSADAVGYANTAVLIACNPSLVKKCPTTPAEFFNTKAYPGTRALQSDSPDTVNFALEAAGVSTKKLNPPNLKLAFSELKKIKPDISVWTESGSQMQQIMSDKQVGMEFMWNGRAYIDKQTIKNLKESWVGSSMQETGWIVPKGAPHTAAAYAFLKWMADHPQNQADWSKALTYPTPTKELTKLLPKKVVAFLPANHPVYSYTGLWFYQNAQEVQDDWQQLLG